MNISTLTVVLLSGLLVTSGFAFAAPDGTVQANADAKGSASHDADETDRAADGRTDGDGTDGDDETGTDDGERDGYVGRLGVAVSAAVGGGASDAEAGADGGDVEVNGDASVERDGPSDDGTGTRERAAEQVRSIHDRVRAFLSGTFGGDVGVRAGLGVFGSS